MVTKGGLETITQHLAMEYAKDGIRVNAVAPGVVYTPLHQETPKDVMESLSPMGRPSTVKDITFQVSPIRDFLFIIDVHRILQLVADAGSTLQCENMVY